MCWSLNQSILQEPIWSYFSKIITPSTVCEKLHFCLLKGDFLALCILLMVYVCTHRHTQKWQAMPLIYGPSSVTESNRSLLLCSPQCLLESRKFRKLQTGALYRQGSQDLRYNKGLGTKERSKITRNLFYCKTLKELGLKKLANSCTLI